MATNDSLKHAFMISVALHLIFFLCFGDTKEGMVTAQKMVVIDMDSIAVTQSTTPGSVGIESFTPNPHAEAEAQAAQKKRNAYIRYLEEVGEEIHAQRLSFGRTDLIGIATYTFTILPDGSFTNIRLKVSSDSSALDDIAYKAIAASTKKVKRPKIIGEDSIQVEHEVRFQYDLK